MDAALGILPWIAYGLILSLAVVGAWLGWVNRPTTDIPISFGARWAHTLAALSAGSIGMLLVVRLPRNIVGWVFIAIGLLGAMNSALDGYAGFALHTEPGLAGGVATAWVFHWLWVPLVSVTLVYFPLVFPDGRLLSPAWGRVSILGAFSTAFATAGVALRQGPLDPFATVVNPVGIQSLPIWLSDIAVLPVAVTAVFAVAGQFARFQRAEDVERHQIKWVAMAAAAIALLFIAVTFFEVRGSTGVFRQPLATALVLAIGLLPLSTAIAVLRYRLYDIDVIINRTFVYVPLTAGLAGLYVSMSGFLRAILTELTDAGSDVSVAISTLMIVAALTPAKNQLQAIVDRRFKEIPDPQKALRVLTDQTRSFADIADRSVLLPRYLEALTMAVGARGAALELSPRTSEPRTRFESGSIEGPPVFEAILGAGGRTLGAVHVYPRSDGRAYSLTEQAAVLNSAECVGRVLGLIRTAD